MRRNAERAASPARLAPMFVLSVTLHAALLLPWPGLAPAPRELAAGGTDRLDLQLELPSSPSARRPTPASTPRTAPPSPAVPVPAPAGATAASAPLPPADGAADATDAGDTPRAAHARARLVSELARYFFYPALARRHGWEGQVLLALTVEPDGKLENLQVARGSGYAVLDAAALQSLQRVGRLADGSEWLRGTTLDVRLPVIYRLTER